MELLSLLILGITAWNHWTMVCAEQGIEMQIANNLLEGYDPGMRPVRVMDEPINVTMVFKLYQIVELDDTSETLVAINWVSLYWIDPLLKWNSSDYGGVTQIYVPSTRLWRPDITIYNGLYEGEQDLRVYDSFNARVRSDGMVFWAIRALFRTSCLLKLAEFPWDTQICNVTMGSWLYDVRHLTIQPDSDAAGMNEFRRNTLWDVLRAPMIGTSTMYPCCPAPFDEITVHYIIRRNGLYYCFNILFPSTLLLGVTLLSFLIPIESGEKIAIPVTMFLSQSFLLFAITQYMPVQSDVIPAIGYILLGIMMLIGLCIICNILVCYVYFKCCGPPPSRQLLRVLCLLNEKDPQENNELNRQNQLLPEQEDTSFDSSFTKQASNYSQSEYNQGNNETKQKTKLLRFLKRPVERCSKCPKHCNPEGLKLEITSEKWKAVAHKLNNVLCAGTLIATFGFAMAVMAIYMENRRNTEKQFHP